MSARVWAPRLIALIGWTLSACATLQTDLTAAQELYRDAHYEAAERWLLEVEPHVDDLPAAARARFFYLRGMSAYRLGHRENARHYLVLGAELLRVDDSEVDAEGRSAMHRALTDLLKPTDGALSGS